MTPQEERYFEQTEAEIRKLNLEADHLRATNALRLEKLIYDTRKSEKDSRYVELIIGVSVLGGMIALVLLVGRLIMITLEGAA